MNERLINQGRLEDLKLKKRNLELSIKGLIQTLRSEADPFKEIGKMDEAMIHEQAFELSQKIRNHKEVVGKMAALKNALGIE